MKSKYSFLILCLCLLLLVSCANKSTGKLEGVTVPSGESQLTENPTNGSTPSHTQNESPNPNAGIFFSQKALTLKAGESLLLEVTYIPAYSDDNAVPSFAVSDPSVATVASDGTLTALKAGSTTVTVICQDYKDTCTVTVEKTPNKNPGIVLASNSIRLLCGQTAPIQASFTPLYPNDSTKLYFASDDTQIVTVDDLGNIRATAPGSTTVTVSDASGKYSAQITVKVPQSFSFLAAGDNLLHSGIYNDARERAGGSGYDFLPIYNAIIQRVQSADFSMINQETVFTGDSPSSYPSLNAPQQAVKALADMGFDIISLANNHCLDKGGTGLAKSMTYLDSLKNVIRLGGYFKKNNDALKIRVIEKNGIKIALLAYTTFTNGNIPSDYDSSGVYVPWAVESNIIDDMNRAKTKADAILVFMHWGEEETFTVTDKQKKLAQLLADNGADIIIGAHPHVIQSIEYIESKDGKMIPCAYSLGTLISNMATEQNMLSVLLSFDFVKDPDSGEITVENLMADPYVFYYDMNYRQSALYRITDFTNSLANTHGVGNYPKDSTVKNTVSVDRLYGYLKDNIALRYLPQDIQEILAE